MLRRWCHYDHSVSSSPTVDTKGDGSPSSNDNQVRITEEFEAILHGLLALVKCLEDLREHVRKIRRVLYPASPSACFAQHCFAIESDAADSPVFSP